MVCLAPTSLSKSYSKSVAKTDPENAEDDEAIIIRGERKKRINADLPGRGVTFTPKEGSQQDLFNLLASESSVNFVDTGRVHGSGFSIPKLRGQGSRSTDVWVDDFLIQDPLTGLPIIDEIDIRAFGIVRLYRGISPLSIHSAHHRGTVQFSPDLNIKKTERQLGVTHGRPYGTSGFFLLKNPQQSYAPAVRFFARDHVTDGEFSYYDDFATPYNTSDDRYSVRKNNHRRARTLAHFMEWRRDSSTTKVSGVVANSVSGLPSRNSHLQTFAEEKTDQTTIFFNHKILIRNQTAVFPTHVRVDGTWQQGKNSFTNQTTDQFGTSGNRTISRNTSGGKVTSHWDIANLALETALSDFNTEMQISGTNQMPIAAARNTTNFYVGGDFNLPLNLRYLHKMQANSLKDETEDGWAKDQAFLQKNNLNRTAVSRLNALSWTKDGISIYGQYGQAKKLPSLIETFGDGGTTRSNLNLQSENEIHREIGTSYTWSNDNFMSYSLFDDQTENKIVFLPSIGETSRAENIGRTKIVGHEFNIGLKNDALSVGSSFTRLITVDQTITGSKQIPGVSETQYTNYIGVGVSDTELKIQQRYRSKFYRDRDNTIEIPESNMYDMFADGKTQIDDFEILVGISVLNIFDIRRASIAAKDSPDGEGATSQGDLGGYPVPGRQFKITIETIY